MSPARGKSTKGRETKKNRALRQPEAERYAQRRLSKILEVSPQELNVEPLQRGTKSLVYVVSAKSRPCCIVYLYTDHHECSSVRRALRLGERHQLPIPRLLDCQIPLLHPLRRGTSMLATDFAEGRHLLRVEWTNERLALLARTLSSMHRVESSRWGKLSRLKRGPITADWRKSVMKRMKPVRKRFQPIDADMLTRIESFFEQRLASIPEPEQFQLCHHHLFGDDIILSPDESRMTILDCGDIGYSRASRDLASVRQGFFPEDDASWTSFKTAYFGQFDSKTRREWEREIPFFEGFYLLVKLRNHLRRPDETRFLNRMKVLCEETA